MYPDLRREDAPNLVMGELRLSLEPTEGGDANYKLPGRDKEGDRKI
jgi:hypothetical protein